MVNTSPCTSPPTVRRITPYDAYYICRHRLILASLVSRQTLRCQPFQHPVRPQLLPRTLSCLLHLQPSPHSGIPRFSPDTSVSAVPTSSQTTAFALNSSCLLHLQPSPHSGVPRFSPDTLVSAIPTSSQTTAFAQTSSWSY